MGAPSSAPLLTIADPQAVSRPLLHHPSLDSDEAPTSLLHPTPNSHNPRLRKAGYGLAWDDTLQKQRRVGSESYRVKDMVLSPSALSLLTPSAPCRGMQVVVPLRHP